MRCAMKKAPYRGSGALGVDQVEQQHGWNAEPVVSASGAPSGARAR